MQTAYNRGSAKALVGGGRKQPKLQRVAAQTLNQPAPSKDVVGGPCSWLLALVAPCAGAGASVFVASGSNTISRIGGPARRGVRIQLSNFARMACDAMQCTPTPLQTADLMQAAITLALKTRLKEYQGIRTDVECDAWGLLEGKFRSVAITGQHWRTPLQLTAHRLEV